MDTKVIDKELIATVPRFLRFKSADDLVRVGKANDGGYLISQSDIERTNWLIGLGLGYDWSFERDFLRSKNVPLHVYDASVHFRHFFRNCYLDLVRLNLWGCLYNLLTAYRYKAFFRGSRVHRRLFISDSQSGDSISLAEVLTRSGAQNIFLKIDIEGGEYRILDTLVEFESRISGLVVEFHDCDLHLDRIERFVSSFPLKVVHVHANNYAELNPRTQIPLVLEVSFSRYAKLKNEAEVPHRLDRPNNKRAKDFRLILPK